MNMRLINLFPALALLAAPLSTAQQPAPAPAPEQSPEPDKNNPYNIADPGLRQVKRAYNPQLMLHRYEISINA